MAARRSGSTSLCCEGNAGWTIEDGEGLNLKDHLKNWSTSLCKGSAGGTIEDGEGLESEGPFEGSTSLCKGSAGAMIEDGEGLESEGGPFEEHQY